MAQKIIAAGGGDEKVYPDAGVAIRGNYFAGSRF